MTDLFVYGYAGLFIGSFLAATILPFSSEGLLVLMLTTGYDSFACILVATLGNWLGGMSSYYLGRLGKEQWIEKFLRPNKARLHRMKEYIKNKGAVFAIFCWLPIIGDILAIALGLVRSNQWYTALYMLLGKAARYAVIAYLIIELGVRF